MGCQIKYQGVIMSKWKASDFVVDPEILIGELDLLFKQTNDELDRVYELLNSKGIDILNIDTKVGKVALNFKIVTNFFSRFVEENVELQEWCKGEKYLDKEKYEKILYRVRKDRDIIIENIEIVIELIKEIKDV